MGDDSDEREQVGLADAQAMFYASEGAKACGMGHHAWMPWLRLPNGSDTTWCARPGCEAVEQYDY